MRFKKLVIQNNALLTMLGEKTEENEELRMDLQDVKEMYKTQVSWEKSMISFSIFKSINLIFKHLI